MKQITQFFLISLILFASPTFGNGGETVLKSNLSVYQSIPSTSNFVHHIPSPQTRQDPLELMLEKSRESIFFSLPKKPDKRYQLSIQKDNVSRGFFRMEGEEQPVEILLLVQTVPQDQSEKPYPVGIATGTKMKDGRFWGGLLYLITNFYLKL